MTLRSFSLPKPYFGRASKPAAAAPAAAPGKTPRAPRRLISGVALTAQKSRLLLGAQALPCRVVDVANGGYCVTLLDAPQTPPTPGTVALLEQTDKTLTTVELRWVDGRRIGLKRLPRGWIL